MTTQNTADVQPAEKTPEDRIPDTDSYLSDQSAFDTDVVWFGVVPILAFCAIAGILCALA